MVGDAIVGVTANPLSGRDIRRLVTQASVFPTAEKANMIQRMLTAFGAVGVQRVLLSTDLGGISAAVLRAIGRHRDRDGSWPDVEFLEGQPIRQTAQDTIDAVRRMVAAGAKVIVCLGGDGTARVTASAVGEVPMLPLSTGTNNAFPVVREATIAGLAAGLVATGAVPAADVTSSAKVLEVRVGDRTETALVDVAVCTERHVGIARGLGADHAHAVVLHLRRTRGHRPVQHPGPAVPGRRREPERHHRPAGSARRLRQVLAPIAPGLIAPVGVARDRADAAG